MMYLFNRFVIFVFVFSLTACGGGGGGSSPAPTTDLPYTVNFSNNATLGLNSSIEVVFAETLGSTRVGISGTLAAESDNGIWSSSVITDDTLTISPLASWSGGTSETLILEIRNTSGNVVQTITLNYTVDITTPQVTNVSPASTSVIGASQQIVISFDKAMNASSLSLGGTMALNSDGGVWSNSGTNSNDTLTITPSSSWSAGAGQTLVVDVNDSVGNSLTSLSLVYDADLTGPSITAINAPNGSILTAAQPVVITFNKTMNTGSLVLGGNMAAETSPGTWSTTTMTNDTLTITPTTVWETGYYDVVSGNSQVLTINVTDILGNPLATQNLSYIVDVISVSTSGNDAFSGTMSAPKKTIGAALVEAESRGMNNVYIQSGTYVETVALKDGINIKGGFDALWSFHAAGSNPVISAVAPITAIDLTKLTRINNIDVTALSATGNGESSYAIRLVNSNSLIVENVTITAGNGVSGANGVNGTSFYSRAADGLPGQNSKSFFALCDDTSSGIGGSGVGSGSLLGGNGGNGGTMDTACPSSLTATNGQAGENAAWWSGGFDGQGGAGGLGVAVCANNAILGGVGGNGLAGANGSGGAAASSVSGLVVSGLWVASGHGGDGGLGTDGMGGGGGGGSGGCDEGTDTYGAGGGGGGAGGARATPPGTGGQAGGFSFGIFAVNSSLTTNNVNITRGIGGNGGNGGNVGAGQLGGNGGSGGKWTDVITIIGGNGGSGGNGGNSGAGAGGAGGSAYGIYSESSTVVANNTTYSGGTAGVGGSGSGNGLSGTVITIAP